MLRDRIPVMRRENAVRHPFDLMSDLRKDDHNQNRFPPYHRCLRPSDENKKFWPAGFIRSDDF